MISGLSEGQHYLTVIVKESKEKYIVSVLNVENLETVKVKYFRCLNMSKSFIEERIGL